MGIFLEPAVPFQADNAKDSFPENTGIHLGSTEFPVNENHGHFNDLESAFIGCEHHFNLEGIAFEADLVERYGFQHLTAVTLESGWVSWMGIPVTKRTYLEAK